MHKYTIIGINGSLILNDVSHPLHAAVSPDFRGKYSAGELGCALSHRMVYSLVSSGRYEHALVIEDDVLIYSSFLDEVSFYRNFILPSWKIIHWHTFCHNDALKKYGCFGGFDHGKKVFDHLSMGRIRVKKDLYSSVNRSEFHGTVAYEINHNSALDLFKEVEKIHCASDGPTGLKIHLC